MNDTPGRTGRRSSGTEEDRIEILKMVESGTISASEASTLLDALDHADQSFLPPESPVRRRGSISHVRVRITDTKSGRSHVNVVLPIGLLDVGLGVMRRFVPNADSNMGLIRDALSSGDLGPLLTVEDDGERVEIIAE
jgi:SHOCT-like domain